jgi:hypothetical protein
MCHIFVLKTHNLSAMTTTRVEIATFSLSNDNKPRSKIKNSESDNNLFLFFTLQ